MSGGLEGSAFWKSARADRFALIVDAEDFFRHAKSAMLQAKRSVYLIGWDFDARIELQPEGDALEGPNEIGPFVNWLSRTRPDVDVHILKWGLGLLHSLGRGETPAFLLYFGLRSRINLRLDRAHPPGGAHHMKLLIVDDQVAFCGGIDMTMGRWDTRGHEENRAGRCSPRGAPLPPWHDVTSCISGPLARVLGDLARDRWRRATGEAPEPDSVQSDPWPEGLVPQMKDIDVAVARTLPEYDGYEEVREIEAATLHVLRSARDVLYIESQYLASRRIVDVLEERLAEEGGPEIVVLNPETADGWLESKAMDSARVRMMRRLKDADVHDRFRIYYPVNGAGTPIYVHSKVMFADDRYMKVGSANLNNRSMGFDTECDLVVDAGEDEDVRAQIVAMRNDLLAEHLDCTADRVAEAIDAAGGRLVGAIEALNSAQGRRLVPLKPHDLSPEEEMLAESDLADPLRTVTLGEAVGSLFRRV